MIPLMLLLCGAAEPDGVGYSFPAYDGNIRLRVDVQVDGKSPGESWEKFLTKLFEHFDRDQDGTLSLKELERVFALPGADGKSIKPDFKLMDANNDGKVTSDEFLSYYRKAGFSSVVTLIRMASSEQLQVSDVLFRQLDRNNYNKLDASELKDYLKLLRRLDENEDELLDRSELLNTPLPTMELPKSQVRTIAAKSATSILQINLSRTLELKLDSPKQSFRLESTVIRGPRSRIQVFKAVEQSNAFTSAMEFYVAQFNDAINGKDSLTKEQLDAELGLQAIAGMFDAADRNGDGKLTPLEFKAFLELIELGLKCQVFVELEDRGSNFFDLVDTNGDGRLDLAELQRMSKFQPMSRTDVPSQYRLTVSRQFQGAMFGPVPIPKAKPQPASKPLLKLVGPAWFQAMDRNRDGFVSAAEFLGTPEQFAKFDRDGDGRISVEEAENVKK